MLYHCQPRPTLAPDRLNQLIPPLQALEELDVSWNKLEELPGSTLGALTRLVKLRASYNQINAIPQQVLPLSIYPSSLVLLWGGYGIGVRRPTQLLLVPFLCFSSHAPCRWPHSPTLHRLTSPTTSLPASHQCSAKACPSSVRQAPLWIFHSLIHSVSDAMGGVNLPRNPDV
jgi:Leucine-rich repeat (LRR) protein